jgi:putative membrane protein
LSDQQIAAITEAANDGEIAQAKIAQGKARNARIKAFAAKMIAHHGQAKEKQSKLGLAAADSQLSKQLKDDAATTLASLNSATAGAGFDQTYMSAQVAGHQKVLDAINDRLLPNVKDDKLAAYVKDIKPTVEAHLKEARDIEQSLGSDKQAGATAGAGNRAGAGTTTGSGTGTSPGTGAGSGTRTGSGSGSGTRTGTGTGTGPGTGTGTRTGTTPATP